MEWISVKDRLPRFEETVLLLLQYEKYEDKFDNDEGWRTYYYKVIVEGNCFGDEDKNSVDGFLCQCPHICLTLEGSAGENAEINICSQLLDIPNEWVTHWMPLPEEPK